MEPSTTGLMLPPPARQLSCNETSLAGNSVDQYRSDRPQATSNLLKKRHQQIQRIEIEKPVKRSRASSQGLVRPPTPFPRIFVDHPLPLTTDGENHVPTAATTTAASSSSELLSAESASPTTRYMPPPQLSEVVDALTCLQENIAVLSSNPEGPTSQELANLAMQPCESIIRDLRAAMATHAACVMRAERHARASFAAEITAILHVSQ